MNLETNRPSKRMKCSEITVDSTKLTKVHVGPVLNISDKCTVEGDVKTSTSYNINLYFCPKKGTCNYHFIYSLLENIQTFKTLVL